MPDIATQAQRFAVAKRAVKSISGSKLDPKAIDAKGSLLNISAAMANAVAEDVERRFVQKQVALTLAGAEGEELDALVAELTFGLVVRLAASRSVERVGIARPVPSIATPGTIDAGTQAKAGSVLFTLDNPVTFGDFDRGVFFTTVTSVDAGSATNVPGGQMTWADTASLFDPSILIIGQLGAAGGSDDETDNAFRARARLFPSAVRRGTLAAIEFGALTVAGVTQAIADEPLDLAGEPIGRVILYVSDVNGNANQALVDKVRTTLREWRCAGVPVRVIGTVPTFINIVLHIGFRPGFATDTVREQARAIVVAAVNTTPPSSPMQTSAIIAALRTIPGIVVGSDALVSPVGDVVPDAGKTIKTTLDRVSFV